MKLTEKDTEHFLTLMSDWKTNVLSVKWFSLDIYFNPHTWPHAKGDWIESNKSGTHGISQCICYNGVQILVCWENLKEKMKVN